MLKLDDVVDLVIPRGSNELVSYIKANTRIPVLGHADGVCHVYVDKSATDSAMVSKLVIDAKTDYPSACNAMETLLLHRGTLQTTIAMSALMSLRAAGVKCLGGPKAMKAGLCDVPAEAMKCEYGDLTCMVEIVEDMDEAIEWIHKYGSGHTEAIVCAEDSESGEEFLKRVDAACVFKNASTRFADGYRFGLGAGELFPSCFFACCVCSSYSYVCNFDRGWHLNWTNPCPWTCWCRGAANSKMAA